MDDQYFATLQGEELTGELSERIQKFATIRSLLETRWRANYRMHYNRPENATTLLYRFGTTDVTRGGQQGELTEITVNHFRNLNLHVLNLIIGTKPSFQARATNSDSKSLNQAKLANELLEYYMKEKGLVQILKTAVEQSILFDAGYIKVEWDVSGGQEFTVDLNDRPVREGDLRFSNPSAWDVVFDHYRTDWKENDWVIVRSTRSKWDLIAHYCQPDPQDPEGEAKTEELRQKILAVPTTNENHTRLNSVADLDMACDDVEVFEFFHRKSAALPNGRYVQFCVPDIILVDIDLPYREIPVYQITAGSDVASQFGYSTANDIRPIQEIINAEYTIISTNHDNFGVQRIAIPRECNAEPAALTTDLAAVFYDAAAGAKPEPLNLVQTPPEIYSYIGQLEKVMETISGVNSVVRGNPEASLKSGTSMALVQNQALAFASHLQESYVKLAEDVGTSAISILRDFATSPRVIAISGKNNQAAMRDFTGDDLQNINRVQVELGNPAARTVAGRVELANNLIQTGLIKNPDQYLTVIETGQLEAMTDMATSQLSLINQENDDLLDGRGARALVVDDHRMHILEHRKILNNPRFRSDDPQSQQLSNLVLSHMQEHINFLQNPNAQQLLGLLGIQGLPPAPMGPPGQGPEGPGVNPEMMQGPQPNGPQDMPPGVQPVRQAKPAQPPPNAMTPPQLQGKV